MLSLRTHRSSVSVPLLEFILGLQYLLQGFRAQCLSGATSFHCHLGDIDTPEFQQRPESIIEAETLGCVLVCCIHDLFLLKEFAFTKHMI
jgi:hypothetical protein